MSDSDNISGIKGHQDYPEILIAICLLAIFSIGGCIGNAFVLFVYGKKKEKSTTTIFILSLAVTDFVTCIIIIPFTIAVEYVSKRIKYDTACKIYMFLITSNVPFSAFIMVLIACDRYLKICRPWNHTLDTKMAKRIIVFLFVFAVSLGVTTALIHGISNDVHSGITGFISSINVSYDTSTATKSEETRIKSTSSIFTDTTFSTITPATTNLTRLDLVYNTSKQMDSGILAHEPNFKKDLCLPNEYYISAKGKNAFQKFYASLFLVSFILVVILYSLVFRSLVIRRARKAKKTFVTESVQHTNVNLLTTNACTVATKSTMTENFELASCNVQPESNRENKRMKRSKSLKNKHRFANVKTAGILFIVTIVFILAFLPAWLMAMRAIKGNIIVFYMHFSYNFANPIIYAFFNQNFRKDIRRDCGIFSSFDKQSSYR